MYSINKITYNNQEYTLIDVIQDNIEVTFLDKGATVLSLQVPDKNGEKETVVMAYNKFESYFKGEMYLNEIIGPTAGRIANGEFHIDGSPYHIEKNFNDTENLHSGSDCYGKKIFDYEILDEPTQTTITFTYRSIESKATYPGNQNVIIQYVVKNTEIDITFIADTTEPTLMNMTNHMYFNLSGNLKSQILDHELFVNASKTATLNENFVPYKVDSLLGTHLDFKTQKPIKDNFYEGIHDRPEKGIDNPYILDEVDYSKPQATLFDPVSKRKMNVYTTYPCIVVYTHNFPDGLDLLFDTPQTMHQGICFETQNTPNGINIDGVEDSILRKGELYKHKTRYVFSIKE